MVVKIYKISGGGLSYIGSTNTKYINTRLSQHKNTYEKFRNDAYGYNTVFSIFDKTDDVKIEVLEECDDNLRYDREHYHINNTECVNKINHKYRKEYYNSKEYYEDNKERIKQRVKNYYHNNKDKTKEQRTKKVVCECGAEVQHRELSRHKKTKKHNDLIN